MRFCLATSLLLLAGPALAADLSSRPTRDSGEDRVGNLEGLFAAVGGGGQITIFGGNNAFGYDVELRLGYSFDAAIQLYLSGALDSRKCSSCTFSLETVLNGVNTSYKAGQIAIFLQYHLLVRPAVMIYARGGMGMGLSGDFPASTSTATGLAEAGGLGVEIRLSPGLYLTPELFYRRSSLSAQGSSDSYQSIGVQLGLVYY